MTKSCTIEKRFDAIRKKLNTVIEILDDLLEDAVFVDNIHGEQEMTLDLTLDVLDRILTKFEPQNSESTDQALRVDDSFDVD